MGGFALLKIRLRKGSLLSKARTPSADKAIKPVLKSKSDVVVKPNNDVVDDDALNKAPVLPGMGEDADASDFSSSTEVSTIVTQESSNGDGTLSSIHSDSLTSFMGNLSPAKIEFTDKRLDQLLPKTTRSPSTMCRGILKKDRSAPNERKNAAFVENLETKIRSSPAAFDVRDTRGLPASSSEQSPRTRSRDHAQRAGSRDNRYEEGRHSPASSENSGKLDTQSRDVIITMVGNQLPSSSRSKAGTRVEKAGLAEKTNSDKNDVPTSTDSLAGTSSEEKGCPAKKADLTKKDSMTKQTAKTIKMAILRPISSPETTILTISVSDSRIMEDFEPTVEIGQEVNDDGNTILTMEVLQGIKPNHEEDAGCDLFGNLFECDIHSVEDGKEDNKEGEEGTTMVSLFDDEGNEFLFEKRQGEDIGIVAASTTSSDQSNSDTRVSNKVGTEIKLGNNYQAGSVVKHSNTLYRMKKQGSGDSSRLIMHKVEKKEVDLVKDSSDSKGSRNSKSSRDSKKSRGEPVVALELGRTSSKKSRDHKESKESKGSEDSAEPDRTNCGSSKKVETDLWLSNEAKKTRNWTPVRKEKIAPRNRWVSRSGSDATSEANDSRWMDDDPNLFQC